MKTRLCLLVIFLDVSMGHTQTLTEGDILKRSVAILTAAGVTELAPEHITVDRFTPTGMSGQKGISSWKVSCDRKNVLLGLNDDGSLYFLSRSLRAGGTSSSVPSIEEAWRRGEQFLEAAYLPTARLSRDQVQVAEEDSQLRHITEAKGKIYINWHEDRAGFPTEAKVRIAMLASSGEIVEANAFLPLSYGPTSAKLTIEEARQRALDWTDQVANSRPDERDLYRKAREDFEKTAPILRWSRGGGGGPGFDQAYHYFLERELRLVYYWPSNHGWIEVDANTGELQGIDSGTAKSTITSKPSVPSKQIMDVPPSARRPKESESPTPWLGGSAGILLIGGVGAYLLKRRTTRV